MKRLLTLMLLGLSLGCGRGTDEQGRVLYDNNDLQLAAAFAARMTCSCLFVMELPDDSCKAWVKASPSVARFTVDKYAKTVEASAFLAWPAKAHFVDDRLGCVIE
jgi:hypothetical protein